MFLKSTRLTTDWPWNTSSSTQRSRWKEPHGHTPWRLGYSPCPSGFGQLFFWSLTYRCFCSSILVQELTPRRWATALSRYAWQLFAIVTRHLPRLLIRSAGCNWLTHRLGHHFPLVIIKLPVPGETWSQDGSFSPDLRKLWWGRGLLNNVTRGLSVSDEWVFRWSLRHTVLQNNVDDFRFWK